MLFRIVRFLPDALEIHALTLEKITFLILTKETSY